MLTREDTIAALATAPMAAAIGIIRVSGPASASILARVVPGTRASKTPRQVFSGTAVDPTTNRGIDEVLCFHCPGPKTATGEDIAEIHGHGGPFLMKKLLQAVLDAGATPAEPGEFTYRAFRNGRFDLTQAEAVMALIGARSERAVELAKDQLDGAIGRSLLSTYDELVAVSAALEAGLDYPDEDLELATSTRLASALSDIVSKLTEMEQTYQSGARLTDGAKVAIVGPPNAGKSSLLNRLTKEDRALVDPDPGTTRDLIEARGEINGMALVFLDTAGLRKGADRIERQGIEKTRKAIAIADLVLVVVDGAATKQFMEDISNIPSHPNILVAANKVDLPDWRDPAVLAKKLPGVVRIPTSATTGVGIDTLIREIEMSLLGSENQGNFVLTTARQHRAVARCIHHIENAMESLNAGRDPELAAADLREARDQFGALFGRNATDDVLGAVFERFCVGK